jgi:hypothetical protein
MVLSRQAYVLQSGFRVVAPYKQETKEVTDVGEIGVQGIHRAVDLKLWLSLRHSGKSGYERVINEGSRPTALREGGRKKTLPRDAHKAEDEPRLLPKRGHAG